MFYTIIIIIICNLISAHRLRGGHIHLVIYIFCRNCLAPLLLVVISHEFHTFLAVGHRVDGVEDKKVSHLFMQLELKVV
jgi:hypothetical protein